MQFQGHYIKLHELKLRMIKLNKSRCELDQISIKLEQITLFLRLVQLSFMEN